MGNFADEYDSRTLAEFWDHLVQAGRICIAVEYPYTEPSDKDIGKQEITQCLRERAARRESSFGRVAAGPQQASETFLTKEGK